MGHLNGHDPYRRLGRKIDRQPFRAPWNPAFHAILRELYTADEADLVAKMPSALSDLERLAQVTGYDRETLRPLLDGLCAKGLVMDLWVQESWHYAVSPFIIGIFECTMMRTGSSARPEVWAGLFREYLLGDGAVMAANLARNERVVPLRTIPHESALSPAAAIEIFDYERAVAIVEQADRMAIGICSCRHLKTHTGEKKCRTPLETCSAFGLAADYLVRHELARAVSRSEMLENIARSRELGLVLNADNVQRGGSYLCHCCGCCCEALLGISHFGYPNAVVTSSFIAEHQPEVCTGCAKCAAACPINAISMVAFAGPGPRKKLPRVDAALCLGCGVCALSCKTKSLRLVGRGKRVLHPESTFERLLLQCLERGTLEHQLFDNPQSKSQAWLRGLLGGFLRLPPVKSALMSDLLRSTFLRAMKAGARAGGRGRMTEI